MLQISSVNRMKFERAILTGYNEYFNNSKYYEFLQNNDLLYYDDDSIKSFNHKRYSNSKEFRLVLSKNFKRKYIEAINNKLLYRMATIINPKEFANNDTKKIIADKIDLIALISFLYFETIDSDLSLAEFENKFNILKYFARHQVLNDKNYLNLSIEDYQYLKQYPKIFCVDKNEECYKSSDEIIKIIDNINEIVNIPNFKYACSYYEQQILGIEYKKM